ncbi:hypothetical protein Ddc_23547 [Ditylenchus destructor]|nr:hypothetical protein Ddc_23547 [Ditylenchus destructor]
MRRPILPRRVEGAPTTPTSDAIRPSTQPPEPVPPARSYAPPAPHSDASSANRSEGTGSGGLPDEPPPLTSTSLSTAAASALASSFACAFALGGAGSVARFGGVFGDGGTGSTESTGSGEGSGRSAVRRAAIGEGTTARGGVSRARPASSQACSASAAARARAKALRRVARWAPRLIRT